jgi:PAS domain S-box-containing protein
MEPQADLPPALRDLLAAALLQAHDAVTITTADLDRPAIVFVNPEFTALTGYAAAEVIGKTPHLLQGPGTDRTVLDRLRRDLAAGRCFEGEALNYRKDGSEFWLQWRIAPVRDAGGRISHFVAVQRDATAQREATAGAERSSVARTEFLARVSHELLTPLNSLIGFPQMLIDGHFGSLNERQQQAVGNTLSAAEQLRQLILDLLDLARIEAGRMQLDCSSFDLGALLADFARPVVDLAQRKGVTVAIDLTPDLPPVWGDPARLKQVALNLLDNAVKYTPPGGRVELRLGRSAGAPAAAAMLHLAVADSGIGVADEDRERIFHLFEQVDPALTRRQPGTGLGLALVSRIVDLHGGRIWVESAGLGQGSTFHVEVPVRQGDGS